MMKRVPSRRMRNAPTYKPKTFVSSRIKKDINPPTIRTFTGAESAFESGDDYLLKKIRQFSNLNIRPADQLQLIGLLRPAFQTKKVIDKQDFTEALDRLQQLKVIEQAPLGITQQLQAIQDYTQSFNTEKKNELFKDLVNNINPFEEDFPDVKLNEVKQVVAPLFSKDEIMALYQSQPPPAEFQGVVNTTEQLEDAIDDLKSELRMSNLPKPLRAEGATEEEDVDELGFDIAPMGRRISRANTESTFFRPEGEMMGDPYLDQLNSMNITELKREATKNNVPYVSRYGLTKPSPLGRKDLINAILRTQAGEFVDVSPAKLGETPKKKLTAPKPKTPKGFVLRQPQMEEVAQEGEGVSDVIGNVLNKLMPRALKQKVFSTFIEKPLGNLFTDPRKRRY